MTAKRSRLTIDVTPELRRRIRIAAAEEDLSVRDYVVGILERETSQKQEKRRGTVITNEIIEQLDEVRDAIMRGRRFAEDSVELIEEGRTERTAEL